MSASQGRDRPPSLLACAACRKKHVRCDARMPICSRCDLRGLDCTYIESRRGYKGPRKTTSDIAEADHDVQGNVPRTREAFQDSYLSPGHRLELSLISATSQEAGGMVPLNQDLVGLSDRESSSGRSDSTEWVSRVLGPIKEPQDLISEDDALIGLFYKNFFPAHPFVVPWKLYKQRPGMVPEHLKRVMRFVAGHYLSKSPRDALWHSANLVFTENVADDGYKVQTLLLLAMASFARFEQVRGAEVLASAIDLALRLRLNHGDFSSPLIASEPILAESWRRTWWDLYIVEGLISVLNGPSYVCRLHSVPCNAPLPGSCEEYSQCRPPSFFRTLHDMQDRAFLDDNYAWSSFAYKVEATRIMGNVWKLAPDTFATKDAEVEAVDLSISNFLLSLPVSKRELIERDGTVDEVLFGAHMVIHWAAINLHRPRSSLTFVRNHYSTACTKQEVAGMPSLAYASHNSKALRAANAISNLTAIQSPLARHTPCYACSVALAATVHLPCAIIAETADEQLRMKERLKLEVSALRVIGEVWPLAEVVKSQVAQFARSSLIDPQAGSHPQTATASSTETPLAPFLDLDMDAMLSNENWLDELLFEPSLMPLPTQVS